MMEAPLVSVVIPVYNAQNTVKRCIDSCLAQTYRAIEVIVINDGSTDGTQAALDELQKNDSRLCVIKSENNGVSAARNRGIESAHGEYLSFVDADDALEPTAIEIMYANLKNADADISVGQLVTVKENAAPKAPSSEKTEVWSGTEALEQLLRDNPSTYSSCGKLYKRSAVGDTRFVVGRRIHEDSFFLFELFLSQPRVAVTNQTVYRIYPVADSAGRADYSDRALDILYFAGEKKRIVEERYPGLTDLTYNVLIKADLAYLSFCYARNAKNVSTEEKRCIREIKKYRRYYVPMTAYQDKLFFAVTHHLYYPLKWIHTNF